MPPNKRANSTMEQAKVAQKIWKKSPPGPEQRELNRLFEDKLIDRTDTPSNVRLRFPMFQAFPNRTFALHFRQTKAKFGLSACVDKSKDDEDDIPELYGTASSHSHSPLPDNVMESLEARNFPFITWIYTDHSKQSEYVCVAVPIFSGSENIKFVLSDDGTTLNVNYVWPSIILKPQELFRNYYLGNGRRIHMEHPMVHAFQNRLSEWELSSKSKPSGSLVIPLTLKVQREVGSYKSLALDCGDTEVALLQFSAFQNKKVISDADNSIKFARHLVE